MKRSFVLMFILITIFLINRVEAKSLKKGEEFYAGTIEIIRIVSSDELEIEKGKDIILGKYTIDGDRMRTVITAISKVVYYKITSDGLVEEKSGEIYYSSMTKAGATLSLFSHLLKGNPEAKTIKMLIDKGADVNVVDVRAKNGWTPLITTVIFSRGHTEIVKILLDKGADVNAKNYDGGTALQHAAGGGFTEIVKVLLAKGADVNTKTDHGYTALMWAAMNGNTEVVKILLNKGADVNAKDRWGRTALKRAEERRHTDIVELLRKIEAK